MIAPNLSLALLLAVLAPASQEREVPPEVPELNGLPERWERLRRGLGVPGAAVGVVVDGEIVLLEAFGVRDVERGLPVTVDTPFYIASVTKTFLATAVMQLVEDREVELDAPVRTYLPRFELADPEATEATTVRDLLCHARGISTFPIVFLDAYSGEITEDRYYWFLKDAQPRNRTEYTNVHYTLAGRIVEAVSGRPWRDYLADEVFAPAGMANTTGYADAMYAREDVAYPTVLQDSAMVPSPVRKTDRTMHAAGGLGSSARDLARWIRLHLSGGKIDGNRLLRPETVFEMQLLHAEMPRDDDGLFTRVGYGLSWSIAELGEHRVMQHGGGYVGAAALISFLPDLGFGVAVVANTNGTGHQLCRMITGEVYDRLLGVEEPSYDPADYDDGFAQLVARQRAHPSEAGSEKDEVAGGPTLAPAAYEGTYRNEHWGTFTIAAEGGGLTARLGDLAPTFEWQGPDEFELVLVQDMRGDGSFEVADGAARALLLDLGSGPVRFERD